MINEELSDEEYQLLIEDFVGNLRDFLDEYRHDLYTEDVCNIFLSIIVTYHYKMNRLSENQIINIILKQIKDIFSLMQQDLMISTKNN